VTLWDFAVEAWARDGVSEACLILQDNESQCVALLLWRAWAAKEGRLIGSFRARRAITLARRLEGEVIGPLRAARRALSQLIEGVQEAGMASARTAARTAELAAERALIDALDAMTPAETGLGADVETALAALMEAWNGARAGGLARSLAAALR
jgi:uncharacterized protein (TIGR02444 family)